MAKLFPACLIEQDRFGPHKIDVDYVVQNWHDGASIYRYENTNPKTNAKTYRYRLFEDLPNCYSQTDIYAEDAYAVMNRLGMVFEPASPIFKCTFKSVKA